MHIEIPHKFAQEEAVRKVRDALEESREKIATQASIDKEEWEGNTLHFAVGLQGKKITGSLEVRENLFVLDAQLPLMWRMFEGKIENAIKDNIRTYL